MRACRSISFLVNERQFTYGWVSNFQEGENSSSIVGDSNVSNVVHQHLVESESYQPSPRDAHLSDSPNRPKRRFEDVGNGLTRHDCSTFSIIDTA
jgi:hypothetical protein